MRKGVFSVTISGAVLLAALTLSGCATEEYVDKKVAALQSDVDGKLNGMQQQVAANSAAISGHDQKLAQLDSATKAAQAKADAAALAASGQFQQAQLSTDTVYFETGSAKLSDDGKGKLTDLANRLKTENKNVHVELHGYTDSRGGLAYNDNLGSRRAESVYDFLESQGIPLNKMEMMSHGEEMPAAPNDTSDGRQQNRRVVIEVVGNS
jgi:outer membrane protein OmpA-like peptidoglycan-associated protein